MVKDNEYYRTLDFHRLAPSVPRDRESRLRSEAFQDLLIALVLRSRIDRVATSDLLTNVGEPDSIDQTEDGDVWEYAWLGEHCSKEYRSSTRFILKDGFVTGIRRNALTPVT